MARKKSTPKTKGVTYFEKTRTDGSVSILTLVRVGKFKPVSKTFKSMEDARSWAEPLVQELTDQGERDASPDLTSLTIGELLRLYLADPAVTSLKRYDAYVDWATWWKLNYTAVKVLNFGLKTIHEARGKLTRTRGRLTGRLWSAITVNRHLSLMRGAWNWGRNSGRIPLERVWPQKVMLKEKHRVRYLSPEELNALLDAVAKDQVMRAAILVAVSTGLRQSELLNLTWGRIQFERKRALVIETKNGEDRAVHLIPAALDALQGLRARPVVSPTWVFLSRDGKRLDTSALNSRWYGIRKAAKLEDFKWHDLRHTAASYLAQNGSTLLEIGGVLGHKSPSMTAKYAHLIQGAPATGHAAIDAMLKGSGK